MSKRKPTPKFKKQVAERADFRCEYCQCPKAYVPDPFEVEHIVAFSLGGKLVLSNVAWSCRGCNNEKSNKIEAVDPVTNHKVPLYNPRKHSWNEHFTWDESTLLIIGISPMGRATVEQLKLNRPELLNLRSLLYLVGLHP